MYAHMKEIQVESPNNRETVSQLDALYHQVKFPVSGMGNILLSHWTKGAMKTPKHHRLLPKLFIVCSPQTNR